VDREKREPYKLIISQSLYFTQDLKMGPFMKVNGKETKKMATESKFGKMVLNMKVTHLNLICVRILEN
jgi:hypothetical protein